MTIHNLEVIANKAHQTAVLKGFWDGPRNKAEMIALMHSELSEALEAIRKPGGSEHIPGFSAIEEELADVVIRIGDFSAGFGLRLVEAINAKMEFNSGRPHRHGKAF